MNKATIISLVCCLLTLGCSSTKVVNYQETKKPLTSDHFLMMSLLDRPVTQDQLLMLAYANQKEQQMKSFNPAFVRPILLIGNENRSEIASNQLSYYSQLIAKDVNAKRISGPK